MALPTSTNEVTARKLSSVISGLWNKIKNLLAGKSDITEGVYYVVGTHDYPSWVANHAYAVNDTVNYNNQIRVCKTAHTSGSSYDSSKWNNLATPVLKGTIDGVTALYTGLKIAYRWPCYGGDSSTYLDINGLGNHYIMRNTSNTTTHLPPNSISFLAYDGTYWRWADYDANTWVTSMGGYCGTAAATAAKAADSTNTVLTSGMAMLVRFVYANSAASKLTLNVNSQGAKDLYINGTISSSSNYTLPAGEHWCFYDGTNWYVWTDGTVQFMNVKSDKYIGLEYTNGENLVHQRFKAGSSNTSCSSDYTAVTISPENKDTYFTVLFAESVLATDTLTISMDVDYTGDDDGKWAWKFNFIGQVAGRIPFTIRGSGHYTATGIAGTSTTAETYGTFDDSKRVILPANSFTIKNIKVERGTTATGFCLCNKDQKAASLYTARNLAVNLANTSTNSTFDGSADQTGIKVSGTLGVGSGGTGKTSFTAGNYLLGNGSSTLQEHTPLVAANNLLSALPTWTATPTDITNLIRRDTGGSATFGQVTFLTVWNYIKDKISSSLGLTETSYGGNAATATKATQDSDGNVINATYFKSSGNVTLVSGTATKIGTQNGADVKLTLPTIPAAVSVKGNAESSYRTGQVNLTPANLGISATTSSVTVGSTTFNKYTHPTTSGNKHVPSGGSSGQFLGWDSDGTAKWVANPNTDKVKATAKTDNVNYKILATASASPTSGNATEAVYDADITLNPSTNTIAANVSGTATTAAGYTSNGAIATALARKVQISGDNYYTNNTTNVVYYNFADIDCDRSYMDHPFNIKITGRNIPAMKLMVRILNSNSTTPGFSLGLMTCDPKRPLGYISSSNNDIRIGYTNEDINGVRRIHLWAQLYAYQNISWSLADADNVSYSYTITPRSIIQTSAPGSVSWLALDAAVIGTGGSSSVPVYVDAQGVVQECVIRPDADVSLILYGDSNYSSVKALYNAGKKLYLVTGGSIQPSGRFEYRIPLTQITYDANLEVNAFYFEQSQDDRNGASEVGSIASYRLDSSGWTMSAKQVGYAVNAGNANNYIGGGGIDTALQGKMATNGSNATNVAGGNIIRSLNDWSNPADAEMIAAASSSGQGKYTLIKLWDTYFKNKVNQIIPNVGYMGANAMTAMQKNGTDTMPGNNCKICLDPNTYYSFGYNGFTCLGHYRPTGSGQKYYGWCGNFAQNGGIVEIDFDYTATVEIARGSITSLPESMDVSFAAMTDNNDFKYGFALDASTIFATSQETMRFEVSGTTSKQIKGHAHLIGRGSASSTQTGTRIFVGAVQITSNDHFLVLNVNNIRIKVTGGQIYDVTYL